MNYSIADQFTSIQGEGQWTGIPAHFIRLAGCNLHCEFCDTIYIKATEQSIDELVAVAVASKTKYVVITGGEPMMYDIRELCLCLKEKGLRIHIETNGTFEMQGTPYDWLAVSPKPHTDINLDTLARAHEIKYLVGLPDWEAWITEVEDRIERLFTTRFFPYRSAVKYVMPIAKDYQTDFRLNCARGDTLRSYTWLEPKNLKLAIDYCFAHPDFRLCVQMHKFTNIK